MGLLEGGSGKNGILTVVFAFLFLVSLGIVNSASAQSPSGSCGLEYDGTIVFAKINNGTQTFNAGATFEASTKPNSYNVWYIIKMPPVSSYNNQWTGETWISGTCYPGIYPNENLTGTTWVGSYGGQSQSGGVCTTKNCIGWTVDWVGTSNATVYNTVPNTPTNLSAWGWSSSKIFLGWNQPFNSTVGGYKIERSSDGGSTWSTISGNTNSNATTYEDSNLAAHTTYYYRIYAINSFGTGSPSVAASATTFYPVLTVTRQYADGTPVSVNFILSQNGSSVGMGGFGETSTKFFLTNGRAYDLEAMDPYNLVLDHWNDTGSNNYTRQISISKDTTITAIVRTIPYPPSGLNTTGGYGFISLAWTPPPYAGGPNPNYGGFFVTNYKIYRSTGSGTETLLAETGNENTYTDNNVTKGQAYYYKVTAVNWAGESVQSNEASATPSATATAPSVPTNLTANAVPPSQINLSWKAPTNNGGAAIANYNIYRGASSGSETLLAQTGNVTSYNDTTVTNGQTYFYKVTAINSFGESPSSSESSAAITWIEFSSNTSFSGTVNADTTMRIDSGVTVTSNGITNHGIIQNFGTIKMNNNADTLDNYGLVYYFGNGQIFPAVINNFKPAKIFNENNNLAYNNVTLNNYGYFNSGAGFIMLPEASSGRINNYATGVIESYGQIAVERVQMNNYGRLDSYGNMSLSYGGEFYNNGTFNNHSPITLSGDQAGETFANGANGTFNNLSSISIPTRTGGYVKSFVNYGAANNIGVFYNSNLIANYGHFNNNGTINNTHGGDYMSPTEINNYGTFTNNPSGTLNNNGFFNNECNAVYNNSGTFTGNAVFGACTTNQVIAINPTNGPSGSQVKVAGNNLMPNHTIAVAFDYWQISTTPSTVTSNSTGGFVATFSVPSTDIGGLALVQGSTHSISATDGTYSDTTTFTITATPSVPSAPQNLAATSGNAQVSLTWAVPSSGGSSAITGYNIYRGTTSGGEISTPVAAGIMSTTYTDTGLTNGQTYYYTVRAVNSFGTSPSSNEVSAAPNASVTIPSAPTGLSAAAVSSSQINLSWAAPSSNGGSTITNYTVYRGISSGNETLLVHIGNVTSYSDTTVTQGQTYYYKVAAVNSAGTSLRSNEASATTLSLFVPYKIQSGLLASDSLANETMTQSQLLSSAGYWTFGGDAPSEKAPFAISRDLQGLHVGVRSIANGTWAGYYAASPNTGATLFHSKITLPAGSMPYQWYQPGMTVETSGPYTNYVTCFADISQWGTTWVLGSVTDMPATGWQYNVLWSGSNPGPSAADCTIITNGTNYLKMYLGNVLAYQNNNLNLQIQSPYNVYLGDSSSYPGQLLNSTYTDYYVTSGEYVTVKNLPPGAATVRLQDSGGGVWASSGVSSGNAMLDVGKYDLPKQLAINVYDSSNGLIGSTGITNIYGGDTYSGS